MLANQLAEVLVEGQQHSAFTLGPCEYVLVLAPGNRNTRPNYVVSGGL